MRSSSAGDGPEAEGEGWLSYQTWTCPITGVDLTAPGQEGCQAGGMHGGGHDQGLEDAEKGGSARAVCLLGAWGVEAFVGAALRFWLRDGIALQVREGVFEELLPALVEYAVSHLSPDAKPTASFESASTISTKQGNESNNAALRTGP